jgi:isoleucyl-tRNA synthetase
VTDDPASTEAFDTLYTVLETLTRVAAPLIPLVSERVWQGLTGGRSVHLEDWPDADAFPTASDIRTAMDAVREVSSVANALRKKEGKRVRLPLPRLTVVVPDAEALAQFEDILRDELNVKAVELVELERARRSTTASRTACRSTPAPPVPRLGKQVQQVIAAARAGEWTDADGVVVVGGIALEPGSTTSCSRPPDAPTARRSRCWSARRLRAARHRRRPSSRPRVSRATSSAPCRTPARPPAST